MEFPASLSPQKARATAKEEVTAASATKSPAAEVGNLAEQAKTLAEHIPGFSFQGEAPSRLSEAVRAECAASWRVTGNWVLILLALAGTALAAVEFANPDTDLQLGSLLASLVVVWVVCQVMRLTMIMGYGKVRLSIGQAAASDDKADGEDEEQADGDTEEAGEHGEGSAEAPTQQGASS